MQKIQQFAKKHVETLNFFSANTKNAILLKQYFRDHVEEMLERHNDNSQREKENTMFLVKEMIELKREILKVKHSKSARRVQDIKQMIVDELREYIFSQVLT